MFAIKALVSIVFNLLLATEMAVQAHEIRLDAKKTNGTRMKVSNCQIPLTLKRQ
jgi:hypothetical protein